MKLCAWIWFLSFSACSSNIRDNLTRGINDIDPKRDPIYDPAVTNYSIVYSAPRFPKPSHWFSSSTIMTSLSAMSIQYSHSYDSNTAIYASSPSENDDFDTSTGAFKTPSKSNSYIFNPQETKCSSNYYNSSQRSVSHVPKKCLGFPRRWNFHFGYSQSFEPAFGWISHLGNLREMMSDLKLSKVRKVYSLISVQFSEHAKLAEALTFAHYLKIPCDPINISFYLVQLSHILESPLMDGLVIAVNVVFKNANEDGYIQIMFDRCIGLSSFYKNVHNIIKEVLPDVSEYCPYWTQID